MSRKEDAATAAALKVLADAGITGEVYEAECDVWKAGRAVQAALGRGPKRQPCKGAVRYPDGEVLCPPHAKMLRRKAAVTGFGIEPEGPKAPRAPCPECGKPTIIGRWRQRPTRCTRCIAAEVEARAAHVAEKGHDCEEHMEWSDVEAPCPACPDGVWRSEDLYCGECGDILQAAGHVHGLWLARADQLAMDDPEVYQEMLRNIKVVVRGEDDA
jgi:hypothetical protein